MGEVKQYQGTVVEVETNREIVMALEYPISILTPKFEWRIELKGANAVFTAVIYVRAGGFLRMLMLQAMDEVIAAGNQHMRAEGANQKRFLEENR